MNEYAVVIKNEITGESRLKYVTGSNWDQVSSWIEVEHDNGETIVCVTLIGKVS